eukprot:gene15210-20489_t
MSDTTKYVLVAAVAFASATVITALFLNQKKKQNSKKSLKLYYFDIPGKGEAIRLACAYSGLEFEDIRMDGAQFTGMKNQGKLPFGQLPVLEVDEKDIIPQTASILRYIGKLSGKLYSDDPVMAGRIDAILDAENDLFTGLSVSRYKERMGFECLDEATIASVRKSLNDIILPKHLANLEAFAKSSKSGWIAGGDCPSIADFALVPRLQWLASGVNEGISTDILKPYPYLNKMILKLLSEPSIVSYYARTNKK